MPDAVTIYTSLFGQLQMNGGVPVVAAGNDFDQAELYAPAFSPLAITVGAFDIPYEKADFSNYGAAVDVWAPGVTITKDIISFFFFSYLIVTIY